MHPRSNNYNAPNSHDLIVQPKNEKDKRRPTIKNNVKRICFGNPKGCLFIDAIQPFHEIYLDGTFRIGDRAVENELLHIQEGVVLKARTRTTPSKISINIGKRLGGSTRWAAYLNGHDLFRTFVFLDKGVELEMRKGEGADAYRDCTNFILDSDRKLAGLTLKQAAKVFENEAVALMENINREVRLHADRQRLEHLASRNEMGFSQQSEHFAAGLNMLEFCYDIELPYSVNLFEDKELWKRFHYNLIRVSEGYCERSTDPTNPDQWKANVAIPRGDALGSSRRKTSCAVKMYMKYRDPNEEFKKWRFEVRFFGLTLANKAATYKKLIRLAKERAEAILTPILEGEVVQLRGLEDAMVSDLGMTRYSARTVAADLMPDGVIRNHKDACSTRAMREPLRKIGALAAAERIPGQRTVPLRLVPNWLELFRQEKARRMAELSAAMVDSRIQSSGSQTERDAP